MPENEQVTIQLSDGAIVRIVFGVMFLCPFLAAMLPVQKYIKVCSIIVATMYGILAA